MYFLYCRRCQTTLCRISQQEMCNHKNRSVLLLEVSNCQCIKFHGSLSLSNIACCYFWSFKTSNKGRSLCVWMTQLECSMCPGIVCFLLNTRFIIKDKLYIIDYLLFVISQWFMGVDFYQLSHAVTQANRTWNSVWT